ncbi:MAG: ABC transporter permease [Rhodospirillales bacterium]|nr:ABC transporter permease [Rhodospirillales bacterium]
MIRAIPTIAAKDLVLLLRDRTALFWIFVLPVLVAIPLGAVFSGGLHALAPLAVQVLDQDDTAASRALLATLEATPGVKLARAASVDAGDAEVRLRRAASVLVLRPGLERAMSARGPSAAVPPAASPAASPGDAPIELRADPARKAEIAVLRGLVADAAVANLVLPQPMELLPSLRQAAGVPGLPRIQVVPVADALVLPPTPYARSFPAAMGWAVTGAAAAFALALAREGWGPTRLRLVAAPIGAGAVALGKALACLVALAASLLLLLALGAVLFGLRPSGGGAVALAFAAAAAPALGLMLLFSQCGRGEMAVSGVAWGVLLVFGVLGGTMLPLHLLPEWMQFVGQASPLRWLMTVLEGVLWRGEDWRVLWRPAAALLGLGLAAFAIGLALFLGRRR